MAEDPSVKTDSEAWAGLLESIVGKIRDAVLVTEARSIDEPGPKIVYANESFSRMTGYATEDSRKRAG